MEVLIGLQIVTTGYESCRQTSDRIIATLKLAATQLELIAHTLVQKSRPKQLCTQATEENNQHSTENHMFHIIV